MSVTVGFFKNFTNDLYRLIRLDYDLGEACLRAWSAQLAVLLANRARGDTWRRQSLETHLSHASVHLRGDVDTDSSDLHLDHAGCRVIFARAVRATRPATDPKVGSCRDPLADVPEDTPDELVEAILGRVRPICSRGKIVSGPRE